jgi:hypothetical protein
MIWRIAKRLVGLPFLALFLPRPWRYLCGCGGKKLNLTDAITLVEQTGQAYQAAAMQTANDQAAADAAQAKADAAKAVVAQDKQNQGAAASAFNSALDQLIEAAKSAKIQVEDSGTQS